MKKFSLSFYALIISMLLLHLTCKKETAPLAEANAGKDTVVVNQTTIKLSANFPNRGEGSWFLSSGAGGIVTDSSNPVTTFTGEYCTDYILIWTIKDGSEYSSDVIKIKFVRSLVSFAGNDTTLTSGNIPLKAQVPEAPLKGKWTIVEGQNCTFANDTVPITTLNVKKCGTYTLRWTLSDQCASASDDVKINVISQEPTKANAGTDISPMEGVTRVTMAANTPVVGTGHWSIASGPEGTFTDPSSPTTNFEGAAGGKFTLRWTIKTLCDSSYDDMQVNLSAPQDFDGNYYKIVTIGNQVWFAENLKTTHYMNGDEILTTSPYIKDISGESAPLYQWSSKLEDKNVPLYGRNYTWYVVVDNRKICPTGWHVPTDYDWQVLIANLGGSSIAGGKLKEAGTNHWRAPNLGATNESGFTAIPAEIRYFNGNVFSGTGFWSITEKDAIIAIAYFLYYDLAKILSQNNDINYNIYKKLNGLSVRCVMD